MDVLLNSNASSALSSVLKGAETEKNPFQYRYAADTQGCSLSGISRTMQTLNASNTVAYSSAVDFQIPKAGLLRGLIVKVAETFTGTAASSSAVCPKGTGMSIVERLELISQGRVIHSQTREALSCLASSQPIGSRLNLSSMMNLGSVGSGTLGDGDSATFTTRIPALFSCFEALQNVYDTNFVGPLTLRVHMAADPFTRTTVNTANPTCSVTAEYIRESAEHQQKRLEADFSDGNLQKLMWNTEHQESTSQTIGTSGASFEIKTNNYIGELWVYVDQTSGTSLEGVEMASVKIEANGQVIADVDAQLLLQYQPSGDNASYGEAAADYETGVELAMRKRYRYSFGLSDDTRRAFGGASARELSNFKVTVTPSASKANAKIHVVAKFFQIVSIEAANGKISTSISS